MSPSFSLKQKIFIVKRYYQGGNSVETVQNDFPTEFRRRQLPTNNLILELVNCFEEYGSILEKGSNKTHEKFGTTDTDLISIVEQIKEESISDNHNNEILFTDPLIEIKSEPDLLLIKQNDSDHEIIENLIDNSEKIKLEKKVKLIIKKVYKCEQCEKEFQRKRSLDRHIESHKKICEICGQKFKNHEKHMQKKHSSEKKFQCVKCGSLFKEQHRLNTHMKIHIEGSFECEICKKAFKNKGYLQSHSKYHLSDRPFKCKICNYGYVCNSALNRHMRVHSDQKSFICSFCGKGFRTSTSLQYHDRIHTGEKPYQCNLCNKSFRAKLTLKTHSRIHSGERPFVCPVCNKAFYDSHTCKVHQRTHTGDYPYKCHLCGKAHNHISNLKSHMKHRHKVEPLTGPVIEKLPEV